MKQAIRYFSLGLFISALLLYGYQYFQDDSFGTSSPSMEEMIAEIEADGNHVVSEQEYIAFTVHQDKDQTDEKPEETTKDEDTGKKDKKDTTKKDEAKEEKDSQEEEEVKSTSFKVKEGMYTPQIADVLVENNIIDDKQKFVKYMDENGYSEYIQLGSFKVNSGMTLKELAEKLTTYPGN